MKCLAHPPVTLQTEAPKKLLSEAHSEPFYLRWSVLQKTPSQVFEYASTICGELLASVSRVLISRFEMFNLATFPVFLTKSQSRVQFRKYIDPTLKTSEAKAFSKKLRLSNC